MTQKLVKSRRATKSKNARSDNLPAVLAGVENTFKRTDLPGFKAGDTIRVHVRIKEGDKQRIQVYEGLVIKKSKKADTNFSFTVRKISHGVGVERMFLASSPKVAKVEIVQTGKVRRSKLYYMRGLEGKKARIERDVSEDSSTS